MFGKHVVILLAIYICFGRCVPVKFLSAKKGISSKRDGRSFVRKMCPSRLTLNCANVMYSKPCGYYYDCSYVGPQMTCCQTGCSGDSKFMCVPEENSMCPYLQPAYYTGMKKCRVEADCERGFICCLNIAGDGYCHKSAVTTTKKSSR